MFLIAMFLYSFYRFSYNTFFNCLILLYPLSCAIVYGYEMAKNTEKEMPKKTDEKPKKDIPKSPDGEGYWVGVVNWSGIVTLSLPFFGILNKRGLMASYFNPIVSVFNLWNHHWNDFGGDECRDRALVFCKESFYYFYLV